MKAILTIAVLLSLPLAQAAEAPMRGEAKPASAPVELDLGVVKSGQIITLPFLATKTGLINSAVCNVPGVFMLERPAGQRAGEKSQVVLFINAANMGTATGSLEFTLGKEKESFTIKAVIETLADPSSVPALPARVQRSYDASLYLEAAKVKDLKSYLFCDLRHFQEIQAVSIPGALNFRLEELRSTPQFRDQTLILIGSGNLDQNLAQNCRRLRQAGCPNAFILRGGIAAWQQAGGAVSGNPQAASSCTPLDAILARDFQQTVFVNACSRPVPPQLIRHTCSLEDAAKMPPGSDFIVLTDQGGMSKLPILPGPTFLLAGGIEALAAKSQELNRSKSSTTVQLSSHRQGCGGCP